MIRRITLQNYMSHAETVIEPAAGLTVLVGPNNCGKSAVVSALETLCHNAAGAYMVRHEEKEARVTVETDDGHTLVWRRRGNTVSYIVDGCDVHRVKGGVPDNLHKLLRLPKVEAGENGEPFAIHFGTQKSPIFLLNEPESRAALFFASSSDAAVLLEMQKRHRNKVKDRKSDEKRLKGEIGKLDAELAALEPLKTLATSVARVEGEYRDLEDLHDQIQTIKENSESLHAHSAKHHWLAQEYQCLAPLEIPPLLGDTVSLDRIIQALVDAERRCQRDGRRRGVLVSLASPPELGDVCALNGAVRSLTRAQLNFIQWSGHSAAVTALRPPPALDNVERLGSLCQALFREEENHRTLRAMADCLVRLSEPPVTERTDPLEKMVCDLESVQRNNGALSRQRLLLGNLTPPPKVTDLKQLADSVGLMKNCLGAVADQERAIKEAALALQNLEENLRVAERERPRPFLSEPAGSSPRRYVVMALASFAGLAAVILLVVFGTGWFRRPNTGSSDRGHTSIDPTPTVVAKADESGKTENPPGSPQTELENPSKEAPKGEPKKEIPKEEPKKEVQKEDPKKEEPKEDPKKEEPKKETPKEDPKNEELNEAKRLRLKQVQQLLDDAEMASQRGKYLDAVLGFGQAAVLYPQELGEVRNPEEVRVKFNDALNHYQAEVEQALRKATEKKPGDK